MEILQKYILQHDAAFQHVKNNLEGVNALSTHLLEEIDFQQGTFYTLLPKSTPQNLVHSFNRYHMTKETRDYVPQLLSDQLSQHPNLSCIIDDFLEPFNPNPQNEVYIACGIHHLEETYYLLTHKNQSTSLINTCLQWSNITWHSLCILFSSNNLNTKSELQIEDIKEICRSAKLILTAAYDGEGYVFWEKNSDIISMGPTLEES